MRDINKNRRPAEDQITEILESNDLSNNHIALRIEVLSVGLKLSGSFLWKFDESFETWDTEMRLDVMMKLQTPGESPPPRPVSTVPQWRCDGAVPWLSSSLISVQSAGGCGRVSPGPDWERLRGAAGVSLTSASTTSTRYRGDTTHSPPFTNHCLGIFISFIITPALVLFKLCSSFPWLFFKVISSHFL